MSELLLLLLLLQLLGRIAVLCTQTRPIMTNRIVYVGRSVTVVSPAKRFKYCIGTFCTELTKKKAEPIEMPLELWVRMSPKNRVLGLVQMPMGGAILWGKGGSFLQRAAMLALQVIASAVLATAVPSVCLSVTRRYCVKTTARSTVQFALLDSKMSLVLYKPKIFPRDDPFPHEILAP